MEDIKEQKNENTITTKEDPLLAALVDKTKRNSRGVPSMNFIDDIKVWTDKYTSEKLLTYLNQYLNKYKYMEANIVRSNQSTKSKIPDIEKCLETIDYMEKREQKDPLKVDYMVSHNLWAKAEVEKPESVFLWLGANIMCEYKMNEAKEMLKINLENAKNQIKTNEKDLDFMKDQMTVCEVNIARAYNEHIRRKNLEAKKNKVANTQVATSV